MIAYHQTDAIDDLMPVIATCPSCADVSLEFTNQPERALGDGLRLKCQACRDFDRDVAEAVIRDGILRPLIGTFCNGGMNDTRHVLCEECGESALEYPADVTAAQLDGTAHESECCNTHGKIVVDDEPGSERVYFRRFTQRELDAGDDLLLTGDPDSTNDFEVTNG